MRLRILGVRYRHPLKYLSTTMVSRQLRVPFSSKPPPLTPTHHPQDRQASPPHFLNRLRLRIPPATHLEQAH